MNQVSLVIVGFVVKRMALLVHKVKSFKNVKPYFEDVTKKKWCTKYQKQFIKEEPTALPHVHKVKKGIREIYA